MPKDNDFPDLEGSLYFTAEEIYESEDNSVIHDTSCLIAAPVPAAPDPAPAVSDAIPENEDLLKALADAKQKQQLWFSVLREGNRLSIIEHFLLYLDIL